jgi:tRNA dimethylallyltransferase
VTPNAELRSVLEKMKEERGIDWLHDKLKSLDEEAASKIDARNYRRTIRALEVIFTTGRKFSKQRSKGESPYHLISIGLTRAREELYQRVDERIESMFANGLIDEVKGLLDKGYSPTLPSMSAIGYRECVSVIKGQMSIEQAKVEMRRITRIFVRRQANWFKESDESIKWFHPNDEKEIEEYISTML